MILILKENTPQIEIDNLLHKLSWMNLSGIAFHENGQDSIAIVNGEDAQTDFKQFMAFACVKEIIPFTYKFKLAGREIKKERTIIQIKDCKIGGGMFAVMAGPCSIESEDQIHETAEAVAAAGANILRGGAFKPRTSPYDFQGLGESGLQYMQSAAKKNNLLSVSEIMDAEDIDLLINYVDILQVGARNMQNFSLLKKLGKANKPILLKRGLSATYMDFLMAAEYILQAGNPNVIFCERGIRTFESYTRNTLDLAAVPVLHELSHLPVIIDPSHGTGIRSLVAPMSYAAIAAGADGLMVEVHPTPDKAFSDAKQTISPSTLQEIMTTLRLIGSAVNRQLN